MSAIAETFADDDVRRKMISLALVASGMGMLVGPPMGTFLYHLLGKEWPFLIVSFFILLNIGKFVKSSFNQVRE